MLNPSMFNPGAFITPIPTPPTVRLGASFLLGTGAAVLTTALPRGVQVVLMVLFVGAGITLIFSHPYRAKIRSFLEERNLHYTPKFAQIVPMFIIWLALMIAPTFAPAPIWITLLFGAGVCAWTYWVFPHIDGTRALAFLESTPGAKD